MRLTYGVLLLVLASACDRGAKANQTKDLGDRPAPRSTLAGSAKQELSRLLRAGDLIFQRSTSPQSEMVGALTRSRWTHMGVVFVERGDPVIFEAVSPVRRTPLREWVARGVGRHYAVKRLRDADKRLSPEVVREMEALGERWLGRPYDSKFRWQDEAFYCSEIAYKLFDRAAHVRIGRIERARDMNLEDARVKRALSERFTTGNFNPDEPVVTPESIFRDEQLVTVHEQ